MPINIEAQHLMYLNKDDKNVTWLNAEIEAQHLMYLNKMTDRELLEAIY